MPEILAVARSDAIPPDLPTVRLHGLNLADVALQCRPTEVLSGARAAA
ncbi:MAG: hypothetical protein M3380_08180 [Chloroflexota bacterium]|nr:hypothetical protein [Chloroflexota bacterium]